MTMNLLTITNEVLKIKNVSIKCVRILDIVPIRIPMIYGTRTLMKSEERKDWKERTGIRGGYRKCLIGLLKIKAFAEAMQ